jgi:hypothetical protein
MNHRRRDEDKGCIVRNTAMNKVKEVKLKEATRVGP